MILFPRHSNGTWFALCVNQLGRDHASGDIFFPIFRTDRLAGPWALASTIRLPCVGPRPTAPRVYEDPFMYLERDGSWHVIWHAFNGTTPCGDCDDGLVAAHHASPDGIHWRESATPPFDNAIRFTNGSTVVVSTRERPVLVRAAPGGGFSHIVSAVCEPRECAPVRSVNCKYRCADFTLVQPLAVGVGE